MICSPFDLSASQLFFFFSPSLVAIGKTLGHDDFLQREKWLGRKLCLVMMTSACTCVCIAAQHALPLRQREASCFLIITRRLARGCLSVRLILPSALVFFRLSVVLSTARLFCLGSNGCCSGAAVAMPLLSLGRGWCLKDDMHFFGLSFPLLSCFLFYSPMS